MRRPSPSLLISLLALFFALGSGSYAAVRAAAPTNAQLERQVKQLTARVATDEQQLAGLHNYAVCQDGIVWDSIAQTWYALHLQVQTLRGAAPSWPDYATPAGSAGKSSFDDQGACAALGITRPQTIVTHP